MSFLCYNWNWLKKKQSNLFNGLKQKQHIRMLLDRAFTAPIQSTSKHTYIGDIIRKICECDL